MVIDLKNCAIVFRDGAGSPHELTLHIGEGTISWEEKRNIQYLKDRGLLDQTRLGDDEPMSVKFDVRYDFLTADSGDASPSPEDFLKQRGKAAAYTSTTPDVCQPYSIDIYLLNVPPCAGTKSEQVLLAEFRWETINHDPKTGQLSVSGKCNVKEASVSRVTATTI